jgi:hypothetical protein
MIKYIASHWELVQKAFDGQFLDFVHDDRGVFLDSLAATRKHLSEITQLIETSVEQLKGGQPVPTDMLRTFAEMHPKSDLLRNLCKAAVQPSYYGDWHNANKAILAGEILGENFAEDADLGNWLMGLVSSERPSSAALVALCTGWFSKPELLAISERLLKAENSLLVPAKFDLLLATVEAKDLGRRLSHVLDQLEDHIWHFPSHCSNSVLARMNRDSDFVNGVFKVLENEATPTEKATFPRLLARSPKAPALLYSWCEAELKRQSVRPGLPLLGLDLPAGRVRPVVHSLLDVVALYPR